MAMAMCTILVTFATVVFFHSSKLRWVAVVKRSNECDVTLESTSCFWCVMATVSDSRLRSENEKLGTHIDVISQGPS